MRTSHSGTLLESQYPRGIVKGCEFKASLDNIRLSQKQTNKERNIISNTYVSCFVNNT